MYICLIGCTSLITALVELPAKTLAARCYQYMFYRCTGLTTAPELPTTTLEERCYCAMFYGCTNLTSAPELPATTLVYKCYEWMFRGCTSLNEITVRFTEWKSNNMTTISWLDGVSAEGTFNAPEALPDTRGVSNIPEGWTKVAI